MLTEVKSRLRQLREELGITQEDLARAARMTVQWYRQVENQGANTSYTGARNLLNALNAEREKRSMPALALDNLELRIV